MKDQLVIVKQKTSIMESMLEEFQVNDDKQLAIVSDKIKHIKTLQKFIEQEKDKLVKPAKAIIAEAKEKYDPFIKKCQNGEIVLKQRAAKYMKAKEEERREKEKKIVKRVEKGTMKTETAIEKLEVLPETKKTIKTEKGSGLRMSKKRIAVIVKPDLVPKEYWIIDEIRVRREALAGKEIPGVEIKEESVLSSV